MITKKVINNIIGGKPRRDCKSRNYGDWDDYYDDNKFARQAKEQEFARKHKIPTWALRAKMVKYKTPLHKVTNKMIQEIHDEAVKHFEETVEFHRKYPDFKYGSIMRR